MVGNGVQRMSTISEELGKYRGFPPSIPEVDGQATRGRLAMTSAPPLRIPTVFIVDDNPGDVELVRIAFEMSGFDVHAESAMDGIEAVQSLAIAATTNTLPDLVLLDLNMPRANGVEVLGFLKRGGLLERVPVVVLSTSQQAEDRRRSLEQGAREFYTKPEHIRDLVRLVQKLQATYLEPAAGSTG
jgi:CheY-like chemotaxis protein